MKNILEEEHVCMCTNVYASVCELKEGEIILGCSLGYCPPCFLRQGLSLRSEACQIG